MFYFFVFSCLGSSLITETFVFLFTDVFHACRSEPFRCTVNVTSKQILNEFRDNGSHDIIKKVVLSKLKHKNYPDRWVSLDK